MAFGFPSASHSIEVDLGVDRQAAREAIRSALQLIGWAYENPHPDIFFARVSMNGWSWGEKLTVRFSGSGSLKVESKCAPFPQLFDWGKNRKNVEMFLKTVMSKAERIQKMNSLAEPRFDTKDSTPLERVLSE